MKATAVGTDITTRMQCNSTKLLKGFRIFEDAHKGQRQLFRTHSVFSSVHLSSDLGCLMCIAIFRRFCMFMGSDCSIGTDKNCSNRWVSARPVKHLQNRGLRVEGVSTYP